MPEMVRTGKNVFTGMLSEMKCRMKMFSVAVTLDTFMSARLVREMPSEFASRISFRYCGTAPSTTPAMKMNMIAYADRLREDTIECATVAWPVQTGQTFTGHA